MWAFLLVLSFAGTSRAACACGYSVNATDDAHHAIFTELFESDFLHIQDVAFNSSYSTGWIPQNYTEPASDGPYGMAKLSNNLIPNYIKDHNSWLNWFGQGDNGGDPGLQLWVRSSLIQDQGEKFVSCAEIVSERDDILYGSFRIGMKTTGVNGTCGAFYFYRNNSQEIDVEFLSAEQRKGNWPVHLVVQNTTEKPTVSRDKSSQLIYHLPFAPGGPDANYNEYRFDWLPDRIDFFANSQFMWSITDSIPSKPGRIHISHWSDGNPFWSRGPPKQDAVMTVSYVKAYFNSTNITRLAEYNGDCQTGDVNLDNGQICLIPNQNIPPNPFGPRGNSTGHTYFFTEQHNMTANQLIYDSPFTSLAREGATFINWLSLWSIILSLGPML